MSAPTTPPRYRVRRTDYEGRPWWSVEDTTDGTRILAATFAEAITEALAQLQEAHDPKRLVFGDQAEDLGDVVAPAVAARVLGVGGPTVARWAGAGRLRFVVTPGGHRRYLTADVAALALELRSRAS